MPLASLCFRTAVAGSLAVHAGLVLFAWIVFRARFEPIETKR
jgi:hypothetical protein